jgi:hypothetical protein
LGSGGEIMEFIIAEEGVPINLGPDGGELQWKDI